MNVAFLFGVATGVVLGMSISLLVIVLHLREQRRRWDGVQSFPLPRAGARG